KRSEQRKEQPSSAAFFRSHLTMKNSAATEPTGEEHKEVIELCPAGVVDIRAVAVREPCIQVCKDVAHGDRARTVKVSRTDVLHVHIRVNVRQEWRTF